MARSSNAGLSRAERSGKSAYAVSLIVKQLSDWVRYEREHQERYSRILYTNIPLHIDAINDYLSKELCLKDVDISDYVELLDETFFRTSDGKYREWWSDFAPTRASSKSHQEDGQGNATDK